MNGQFFKTPNIYEDVLNKTEYILLKDNLSKKVKINLINNEKEISGILEEYLDNNIIISNPSNGNWILIPLKNILLIEFEEKINI